MTPPPLLETRDVLAGYLGRRVRCRGVVMRDDACGRKCSFLCRLDVWLDGAWRRVATHGWVPGARLAREWGRGVLVEFAAVVRGYESNDPTAGTVVMRFGLGGPTGVVPCGPADLLEMVGELCSVWGWNRVADAVERAHDTHGGS